MLSKSHTKYIQSLQHKKERDAAGLFIAEGPRLVAELLQGNRFICKELVAVAEWLSANRELAAGSGAAIYEAAVFEMEKITALSTPNQVLAVFEKATPVSDFKTTDQWILALDTIQDPGNMGTIIRIADWFGIGQIVCSEDCADMYNPKVVQSTMGSIARVNIIYTNLNDWIAAQNELPVYATAMNGTDITKAKEMGKGIIIIGNEGRGVSNELMNMATEKISIPRYGGAESLNAAVATGIILSHIR